MRNWFGLSSHQLPTAAIKGNQPSDAEAVKLWYEELLLARREVQATIDELRSRTGYRHHHVLTEAVGRWTMLLSPSGRRSSQDRNALRSASPSLTI